MGMIQWRDYVSCTQAQSIVTSTVNSHRYSQLLQVVNSHKYRSTVNYHKYSQLLQLSEVVNCHKYSRLHTTTMYIIVQVNHYTAASLHRSCPQCFIQLLELCSTQSICSHILCNQEWCLLIVHESQTWNPLHYPLAHAILQPQFTVSDVLIWPPILTGQQSLCGSC